VVNAVDLFDNPKHRTYIILALLVISALFMFWIRIIPLLNLGSGDVFSLVQPDDPIYALRQIDLTLANFPNYAWFDPMTQYPVGSTVYWGPLLTYLCSCAAILVHATTPAQIITVSLFIPVLEAVVMVFVMYWLGKTVADWKTGLFAAFMIASVSGQFFFRSMYGSLYHHIGETLFSTLFCLLYLYTLLRAKKTKIVLADLSTYKEVLLFAVLSGIAFFVGILNIETIIVFALIAAIFTFVQAVVNHHRSTSNLYLALVNTVVFGVVIIGLLLFGFKDTGLDLSRYTAGPVLAYGLLIAATIFLYLWSDYLKDRKKYYYLASLAVIAILFSAILALLYPALFSEFTNGIAGFFGQAPIVSTVEEDIPWSLAQAWSTFNFGLILAAGGIILLLWQTYKKEDQGEVFVLIWSVVMLVCTVQRIKYEYYFAVNIALLSALSLGCAWNYGAGPVLSRLGLSSGGNEPDPKTSTSANEPARSERPKKGKGKGAKSKRDAHRENDIPAMVIFSGTVILAALFIVTSVMTNYAASSSDTQAINPDWQESLVWMANNTPDPGVNYYAIYDKSTFTYPNTSYGVMSWWDYGHLITYIAHRIPNANPFQAGVTGPDGAAAYFMATDESTADTILDHDGTRYVITDVEMDTGKFYAMATWYSLTNATSTPGSYQLSLMMPSQSNPNIYQSVTLNEPAYYSTMISRLHNYDGSMTTAGSVYYVEYSDPSVTQTSLPELVNVRQMNASDAINAAAQYNQQAQPGYHAAALNVQFSSPITDIPALQHYRLVHESPTTEYSSNTSTIQYVKIFEYVKGAHINGTGIIDLPLVTNTGRNFTYRQASVNGEFVVPYATTGSTSGVHATGPYQIEGTGTTFTVSDEAVEQGLTIN
jgi:dolichyl-diphosphooligosaccharide--protein glycosyltransferase